MFRILVIIFAVVKSFTIKMNIMAYRLLAGIMVIAGLTFSSCNKRQKNPLFEDYPQLNTLDSEYKSAPEVAKANELLRSLSTVLSDSDFNSENLVPFLEYGYAVADEQNMNSRKASFLFPLIKEDFRNEKTDDRLYELIGIMGKMNKSTVVLVLSDGMRKLFPDNKNTANLSAVVPDSLSDIDAYILDLGKKIFENPDNTGINRATSLAYVDACEAYALVNPNNPNTAGYLFKAAEVAKSLRTFPKSLSLYDWIIQDYPDYEKMPTSLFLKGFIIENNLGDDEKARQVYNEFVTRFPNHELADDVQFLIENLGKTDEEILEMIEQKRQEKQSDSE